MKYLPKGTSTPCLPLEHSHLQPRFWQKISPFVPQNQFCTNDASPQHASLLLILPPIFTSLQMANTVVFSFSRRQEGGKRNSHASTRSPDFSMGERSPVRIILLFIQENHMDQGGRKQMKKCPPAGTGMKIEFPRQGQQQPGPMATWRSLDSSIDALVEACC